MDETLKRNVFRHIQLDIYIYIYIYIYINCAPARQLIRLYFEAGHAMSRLYQSISPYETPTLIWALDTVLIGRMAGRGEGIVTTDGG